MRVLIIAFVSKFKNYDTTIDNNNAWNYWTRNERC